MSDTALILIGASGPILGAALAYLLIRRLTAHLVVAAPSLSRCSRCDKQTPANELRPWTELRMQCCPDCDRSLTELLFPDPTSPDYDPNAHRGFLTAYREARQTTRPTE